MKRANAGPNVVSLTDLYIWAVIARSVNDEAIST